MSKVQVDVKPVLELIRCHASGDYAATQNAAVKIAEELDKAGEHELSLYILAQYELIPTWVPQ